MDRIPVPGARWVGGREGGGPDLERRRKEETKREEKKERAQLPVTD